LVRGDIRARRGGDDEGERLTGSVVGLVRSLCSLLGDPRPFAGRPMRICKIELEVDVDSERPGQFERPFEQ
jgi:hypothetical protein